MTVDKGNRHIVLFSGGFDSTLVLANLVREASESDEPRRIIALSINHNLTGVHKLRREYESQCLIIRALREKYPKVPILHETISITSDWNIGDTSNSTGLSQPILWACNVLPLLEDNDTLYTGYLQYDQVMLHMDNLNNLFKAALAIQENKKVYVEYPLKYFTKAHVLKQLFSNYEYLIQYCISCENDLAEYKVCGSCTPCITLKDALLSLWLNESSDISNKAYNMLKQLFNLNLAVIADDEIVTKASNDDISTNQDSSSNDMPTEDAVDLLSDYERCAD